MERHDQRSGERASYDNDFRVATLSVDGSSVAYTYDGDSLLQFALDRSVEKHQDLAELR